MADRASASIVIGGILAADLVQAFQQAVENDHGRLDWEGEPFDPPAIDITTPLELFAYDLPGGVFDALEPFCEFHKLAFVRTSGSCAGAFGPERVVYTGDGAARHFEMNESEDVVLTLREWRDFPSADAVEAWFASADFTPPPFQIAPTAPEPTNDDEVDNG